MRFILATVALLLAVAACGQKGPLKLPTPPTPPGASRPAPQPASEPVQKSEPPSPGTGQSPFPPDTPKP